MTGRVQQHVQESASVVGFVVGEVPFDLLDGLAQHVQAISELVELLAGHDQLVLAQTEFAGATASFVVALATGALAVLPGPTGACRFCEPASAPSASERRSTR
ncbi:MAG: hypothetical protein ACLPVY_02145 [Acidimicrobiia bacterium]